MTSGTVMKEIAMSRTVYYTSSTLDGYLADENDALDWLFVQDIDQQGPMNYDEFIAGIGSIVMGRTTYQWILDHNARTGEQWAYEMPSWVMTHRELPTPDGAQITFAHGDVAPVHAELVTAAAGKDVWVVGGGDLAAQFAEAGLLDEVIVTFAPVTLGAGRPLFPRPFDFELVEFDRNRAFLCARYAVRGARRS
jgi:dihydrofolate reductase